MKHSNTQKRNTRSTTARHLGQIPQKDFFAEMETRRQQLIKYPTVNTDNGFTAVCCKFIAV